MTVSIQVLRDSFVKPAKAAPPEEVELAGVDVLFKHMNLRFAFFFPETLNAGALKASLGEVSHSGSRGGCGWKGYACVCVRVCV